MCARNTKNPQCRVCVLHSKSQNKRSAMSLEQRHSLLAYVWEAVLFTYWPCNLKEAWYSTTNCICIMACGGIVCSGVVFVQKRLHYVPSDVAHLSVGRLWDCTTQVRKLCVVLFYVQPIFLVVCGLIYACVSYMASCVTKSTHTLCSICRHCIDLVLGACVVAMAMQDNKCMHLIPYAIQLFFLAEYTSIRYLFQQTYLLTVFVCLY